MPPKKRILHLQQVWSSASHRSNGQYMCHPTEDPLDCFEDDDWTELTDDQHLDSIGEHCETDGISQDGSRALFTLLWREVGYNLNMRGFGTSRRTYFRKEKSRKELALSALGTPPITQWFQPTVAVVIQETELVTDEEVATDDEDDDTYVSKERVIF